jgi:hypothetical protein
MNVRPAATFVMLASLLPTLCIGAELRVTVPGGTAVPVQVVGKISSATANVGDTFGIQAASDVVVNGWIVIPKGSEGEGVVAKVDRAGKHGHPGSLGLQMHWIYDADGHKIRLSDQDKSEQGQGKQGESSTVTIISSVLLGIPGLFAHNFVKGKDVVIDSSRTLHTFVDHSVYVEATKREAADPGFAPSVGNRTDAAPAASP